MSQKPDLKDINGLELDRRVWAYDEDRKIAEIALKGRLEGEWEWLEPKQYFFTDNFEQDLKKDLHSLENATQLLSHEDVEFIALNLKSANTAQQGASYIWLRTLSDGYLSYLFSQDNYLKADKYLLESRTHFKTVQMLRTHTYLDCSVKEHLTSPMSFGSRVYVNPRLYKDGQWLLVTVGDYGEEFIHKSALEPSSLPPLEWVKQFLGTPYLWGGRTAWGIDCSGLAQMYFRYQNIYIPRDADQQEAAFTAVSEPRVGDLAFFDGHVGILLEQNELGNWRMLHANSRHMSVTVDTLGEGEYGTYLSSILHGFGRWEGEIGVYWKPK